MESVKLLLTKALSEEAAAAVKIENGPPVDEANETGSLPKAASPTRRVIDVGAAPGEPASLLDTLADLAALQSPVKQQQLSGRIQFVASSSSAGSGGLAGDTSPRGRLSIEEAARGLKSMSSSSGEIATYLERMRRPRAMSEPWMKESDRRDMIGGDDSGLGSWFDPAGGLSAVTEDDEYGGDEGVLGPLEGNLDSMMASYQHVYNRGGRIGIYTRDERDDIIRRFHEKRKRRVWKKKIRYHCRKNLADRRVRIKGRFVKAEDMERMGLLPGGANHHQLLEAQGRLPPAKSRKGGNKRPPLPPRKDSGSSGNNRNRSNSNSGRVDVGSPPQALSQASQKPFDPILAAQAFGGAAAVSGDSSSAAREGAEGGNETGTGRGGSSSGSGNGTGVIDVDDDLGPYAAPRKRMRRHSIAY